MYHRIRTLIPYLNLSQLRKAKLIPKTVTFSGIKIGGNFPALAAKLGYSEYGLLMEKIIEECVESTESIEQIHTNLLKKVPVGLSKYYTIDETVSIYSFIRSYFQPNIAKYQLEWSFDSSKKEQLNILENDQKKLDKKIKQKTLIQGHPDFVYQNTVYDIKTTGQFNRMRVESLFQVLCYYCLAQLNNLQIDSIGLILPAQRRVISYNIKDWKWQSFWWKVIDSISLKLKRENLYAVSKLEYQSYVFNLKEVGYTISKSDLITHIQHNPAKSYQFFIKGNANCDTYIQTHFQKQIKMYAKKANLYIHAALSFNLCQPEGKFKRATDTEDIPWVCSKLSYLMKTAAEMGIKGVVVHCGKTGKLPKHNPEYTLKTKIENMRMALIQICKAVKIECPLLLETSSGQNGETLTSVNDLISFYYSLPLETRNKMKICVDTCHTFASGHDPDLYIKVLEKNKVPIGLIHYNDSKLPKSSFRDRHARIGTGYIGFKIMNNVLKWAIENHIDLVYE